MSKNKKPMAFLKMIPGKKQAQIEYTNGTTSKTLRSKQEAREVVGKAFVDNLITQSEAQILSEFITHSHLPDYEISEDEKIIIVAFATACSFVLNVGSESTDVPKKHPKSTLSQRSNSDQQSFPS